MNSFRFSLQKVLDWRRTQLDMEEQLFRQQSAAMARLEQESAQLTAAGNTAELQVRTWNPVAGGELAALGNYRLHVKLRETEFTVSRAQCRKELERREKIMLETRRRMRLLERLKEHRMAEWCKDRDKELEDLASDAYLAKWKPRRE
jgi:hypothetical protein